MKIIVICYLTKYHHLVFGIIYNISFYKVAPVS